MKKLMRLFGVAAVAGVCWFASAPARATVVAYWKFEGTGSTFLQDSSGNGNHLTNNGGVLGSNFVSSVASVANGSSQSAFFADAGGKNLFTTLNLDLSSYNAITVEAYIKGNFLGGTGIIYEHSANFNSHTGGVIGYIDGTSTLESAWRRSSGYFIETGSLATPSDWHHVAFIYDKSGGGNKMTMYVDGVLFGADGSTSGSGTPNFLSAHQWFIGGRGSGATVSFAGFIDEMRISSGVLTPDQFLMNQVVPEPSTAFLLGVGGIVAWRAYRRRKQLA